MRSSAICCENWRQTFNRSREFNAALRKSGAVDDGFKVSGRWSLVSGCELADWIPAMCVVEGGEPRTLADGSSRRGWFTCREAPAVSWISGTSAGCGGTGSHGIVVDDVFVPAERTFSLTDSAQYRPLSRMPFFATGCAGCAALCLGIAQSATDTLLELASSKVQVDPFPALRDRPWAQALVASSARSWFLPGRSSIPPCVTCGPPHSP